MRESFTPANADARIDPDKRLLIATVIAQGLCAGNRMPLGTGAEKQTMVATAYEIADMLMEKGK